MSKDTDGGGRSTHNDGTWLVVESIHRILWLLTTIGAIGSFLIAVRHVGQPDPMTGLAICSALAPYTAARAWDELFRETS